MPFGEQGREVIAVRTLSAARVRQLRLFFGAGVDDIAQGPVIDLPIGPTAELAIARLQEEGGFYIRAAIPARWKTLFCSWTFGRTGDGRAAATARLLGRRQRVDVAETLRAEEHG